jgi:hypothetical protein
MADATRQAPPHDTTVLFVGNADTEEMRWDIYSPSLDGGAHDVAHVFYDTPILLTSEDGRRMARRFAAAPAMEALLRDLRRTLDGLKESLDDGDCPFCDAASWAGDGHGCYEYPEIEAGIERITDCLDPVTA